LFRFGRYDHVNHCREIAIMSNRHRTNDARSSDALFAISYVPRPVEMGKRALDILAALAVLAITAPLWPLIALAIKLDSAGPVFYRQIRVGRAMADRTELFAILKFRSMRADAEARTGAVLAQKRDPRITRVGAFLRKTRMDELPQLLNVLKGDMSLVGPRPHALATTAGGLALEEAVPVYSSRHRVKPGITGWAQVNGYRGALDSVEKIVHRVNHDLYYIENWSLGLDLKILWRTARLVFADDNAF
jgi:exopolysaccharide biosynthesis polyprenyl glycosylphosphotransferase